MINTMSDSEYVASLMERARKAQKIAEGFTQEQVLELSQAIGWTTVLNAEAWAKLNYEETGLGNWESKYGTLLNRVKGVLRDHVTAKSVGICERDDAHGLIKIAKPVGVVGAICPLTGAAVTPILKAMNGIMGRYPDGVAIICSNNDDMAIAAARTAAGNPAYENTIFLGFDGQKSACEAILEGNLTMSAAQNNFDIGYKAVETMVKILQGEEYDAVVDTGTEIITQENAQDRLDRFAEWMA